MKELSGEQFQTFYVFVALLIAALSLFPLLPINGDVLGCGQITQARYLVAVMALLARGVVLLDRAMELCEGEGEIVWLGRLLPLPIVLLLHALVVLEALLSLARRGKSVCRHSPSAKEFLQTEAHRLPVRFGS